METNSTKKLTKGSIAFSCFLPIPKKTFTVCDRTCLTRIDEYIVGYYVGTSFHVCRRIREYSNAIQYIVDSSRNDLKIVKVYACCYVLKS